MEDGLEGERKDLLPRQCSDKQGLNPGEASVQSPPLVPIIHIKEGKREALATDLQNSITITIVIVVSITITIL